MRFGITAAGAVAGGILAGSVLAPVTASATIKFEPKTNTGFVDAADVRKAFGWNDAALRANAARVTFVYSRGVEELYSVACDRHKPFEMSYNPGSPSADLTTVVKRHPTTGTVTRFQFTGAHSGASSMSYLPAVGGPCPESGGKVNRVSFLERTITKLLTASFGDRSRNLMRVSSVVRSPAVAG
jgi:hypothetical protein